MTVFGDPTSYRRWLDEQAANRGETYVETTITIELPDGGESTIKVGTLSIAGRDLPAPKWGDVHIEPFTEDHYHILIPGRRPLRLHQGFRAAVAQWKQERIDQIFRAAQENES